MVPVSRNGGFRALSALVCGGLLVLFLASHVGDAALLGQAAARSAKSAVRATGVHVRMDPTSRSALLRSPALSSAIQENHPRAHALGKRPKALGETGRAHGLASSSPHVASGLVSSPRASGVNAAEPVIAQALGDLSGHVHHLPLGGPTVLPPEPPSHTYLTAETSAHKTYWLVRAYKTSVPYAVNNPAIGKAGSHRIAIASFGVVRPTSAVPHSNQDARAAFLWRESLLATGLSPDDTGPLLPSSRAAEEKVDLGDGVNGTLLTVSAHTVTLLWHEGDWTLVVRDTTPQTAVAMARPVVAYLHKAYMPPYPGLVAIGIGVEGVYTRIAWMDGPFAYHLENDLLWGNNPVAACAMAVHWHSGL